MGNKRWRERMRKCNKYLNEMCKFTRTLGNHTKGLGFKLTLFFLFVRNIKLGRTDAPVTVHEIEKVDHIYNQLVGVLVRS